MNIPRKRIVVGLVGDEDDGFPECLWIDEKWWSGSTENLVS
jgi:hypothetical protein